MSDFAPYIDLLTGGWKRAHFEAAFSRAVSDAQRLREPLAVLHLDVDNLQEHNDVHGKPVVDAALASVASLLASLLDGDGPVGRMGGDELATFLPGWSVARASRLAEELRRSVARATHRSPAGPFQLTVSVGVVALRRGEPWGNLLEAAERACTQAKQGGRDVVVTR
jgi:diguanylate cyclase (GGDEF)-like protein